MISRRGALVVMGTFLGAPLRAISQEIAVPVRPQPRTETDPAPHGNIRIDADMVLVPVGVSDPMNRPVTGLEQSHFRVFDDNVEQNVTAFYMDNESVAVGLVFDVSGSMGSKLRLSRMAATTFFRTANEGDEFFLVEFSDSPRLSVELTSSVDTIQNRLVFSESKGRTALFDGLVLAFHELKKSSKARKALLIISDGGDNNSRYNEVEIRRLVRENDALIYAMGIYGGGSTPEETMGPTLLRDITEQTGGRHFIANAEELPDIAAKIGLEMRNRYVLGYSPAGHPRDGKYHALQVKLVPPKGLPPLKAYWRHGYYAPSY